MLRCSGHFPRGRSGVWATVRPARRLLPDRPQRAWRTPRGRAPSDASPGTSARAPEPRGSSFRTRPGSGNGLNHRCTGTRRPSRGGPGGDTLAGRHRLRLDVLDEDHCCVSRVSIRATRSQNVPGRISPSSFTYGLPSKIGWLLGREAFSTDQPICDRLDGPVILGAGQGVEMLKLALKVSMTEARVWSSERSPSVFRPALVMIASAWAGWSSSADR